MKKSEWEVTGLCFLISILSGISVHDFWAGVAVFFGFMFVFMLYKLETMLPPAK